MERVKPMKVIGLVLGAALMAASVYAMAAPLRGIRDGLTVVLTTDPPLIALGRSQVFLELREGGQPVSDAEVRVLVRMPNMDMGEREEAARPVEGKPGAYVAPAVFSMAGSYVADITVVQKGRQRKLQLKLATGMDTGERSGSARPLVVVSVAVLVLFAGYTILRMRRTGQRVSLRGLFRVQVLTSLLLLVAALVASIYAVRSWRRPGAMTPIEAQAMEMATPPPPGVAPVTVAEVDRGPVEETVTYVGQAAGWVDQDIYPRAQGWIVEMPVYVGSRVRRGDLLARLDTSEVRPVIEERAAGVRSAREDIRVADAEITQAQASVERAQADVRAEESAAQAAAAEVTAAQAGLSEAEENLTALRLAIREAVAAVKATEEEHAYRDAELRRAQSLRERGALSVQELERARADAIAAEAARDQARSRVRQTEALVRSSEAKVRFAEAGVAAARQRQAVAQERLSAMRAELVSRRAMLDAANSRRRVAQADTDQARAQLRAARTAERYTEIRATADGIVTHRLVAPGVLATPGQAILRMSQTVPVRLQASVSESDLVRIRPGAAVEIWRHGSPDTRIRATVSSVSRLVDVGSRTGVVEAIWQKPTPAFAVGEAISMRITVASRNDVVRVPTAAVQERVAGGAGVEGRTARYHLWVARSEGGATVARRVVFTPGLMGDRYIESLSGIAIGDRIVIEGGGSLRDGDEIVPIGTASVGTAPATHTAYICTMCPEVREDRPGRCPKCGMALVREGSAQ